MIALYSKPINIQNDETFEASLRDVQAAIDVAAGLQCRRIVFPPLGPPLREGYDYARLAEGCRRLAEYIGSRDMAICLENHHRWPLSYAEDYERLFSLLDDKRVGVALDTGHFHSSSVNMPVFIDRFFDHIHHVHLKDRIGTENVPFGEGEADVVSAVARLREKGYDGYASIEIETKDKSGIERALARAKEYCEQTLGLE